MIVESNFEVRFEGVIASPPEVVRPAGDPSPLVRCRVSVELPHGGNPEKRSNKPTGTLSLLVVAAHWQPAHALAQAKLGDDVAILGELRRNPDSGRMECWAEWLFPMCTPADVEAGA